MDITILEKWRFEMSEGPANFLLRLVLEGKKRATASSLRGYEIEGEPLPKEGALSVITFDIAKLEGEDDDLASWQRSHQAFFEAEGAELGYPRRGGSTFSMKTVIEFLYAHSTIETKVEAMNCIEKYL